MQLRHCSDITGGSLLDMKNNILIGIDLMLFSFFFVRNIFTEQLQIFDHKNKKTIYSYLNFDK